ncbi:lipoprotein [Rhodoferax sp.]|uniref:LPS translocon maturation chaperone LptM n=1 Tax=Rhodoferax sp. TaxID=50421 RepID=UPI0026D5232B
MLLIPQILVRSFVLGASAVLMACGQQGPLYLPDTGAAPRATLPQSLLPANGSSPKNTSGDPVLPATPPATNTTSAP